MDLATSDAPWKLIVLEALSCSSVQHDSAVERDVEGRGGRMDERRRDGMEGFGGGRVVRRCAEEMVLRGDQEGLYALWDMVASHSGSSLCTPATQEYIKAVDAAMRVSMRAGVCRGLCVRGGGSGGRRSVWDNERKRCLWEGLFKRLLDSQQTGMEEAANDVKLFIFFESIQAWGAAAQCLAGMFVYESFRCASVDVRAKAYLRVAELYVADGMVVAAEGYIAKGVRDCPRDTGLWRICTSIRGKLLELKGKFLEAARLYYDLVIQTKPTEASTGPPHNVHNTPPLQSVTAKPSRTTLGDGGVWGEGCGVALVVDEWARSIGEEECSLSCLWRRVGSTIMLASVCEQKRKVLSKLVQEDPPLLRATPWLTVITKMSSGELIGQAEAECLEGRLEDYQKLLITAHYPNALRSSLAEHSLFCLSRLYKSIKLSTMADVMMLGDDVSLAERIAGRMIAAGNLKAQIDQRDGILDFTPQDSPADEEDYSAATVVASRGRDGCCGGHGPQSVAGEMPAATAAACGAAVNGGSAAAAVDVCSLYGAQSQQGTEAVNHPCSYGGVGIMSVSLYNSQVKDLCHRIDQAVGGIEATVMMS
eukprot:GHVQ01007555.1.p1 GENE.GHVQ01007555.1~~GHVQ01007555.1.p1  ORF type:complete len:591 (-),score=120.32 GHVQ01007555.1:233-2005(-)